MAKKSKKQDEKPVETQEESTVAAESNESEHSEDVKSPAAATAPKSWFARYWHWVRNHKKISIPAAVVLGLLLVGSIPHTRYAVAGVFMRQSFPVVVVDSQTGKPVSSALVQLDGKKAETDNKGRAAVSTNVGFAKLSVTKKYYEDFEREVVVPIGKPSQALHIKLKAQGRPVPITVVNKISKKPAANITLVAEGAEAKTDNDGKATLVVPADKKELKVTLSGEGYNKTEATLTVTAEEVAGNVFGLTPGGKIYFLSNASGKIDLVKSDLDGGNRQVVLPGTGKENRVETILLASRDWKYIALLSKRDGGEYAKLFLVETTTDKLTVMDEGDATFGLLGWSSDRFVYTVDRVKLGSWQPKRQALKSYHAPNKKITTLVETAAEGNQYAYANQRLERAYVLDQQIVYAMSWGYGYNQSWDYYAAAPLVQNKQATFESVRADGTQKKVLKSYANPNLYKPISTRPGSFGEIYIQYYGDGKNKYDEYHNGKLVASNWTDEEFYNEQYPNYVVSPTGNKTLWREFRDGKNVFFVGDASGENGKEIGRSEDYEVYGWFSDDYVLLTRKGSEMHIMPADGLNGGVEKSLKISDYYKPDYTSRGFGYGYGG